VLFALCRLAEKLKKEKIRSQERERETQDEEAKSSKFVDSSPLLRVLPRY
jgi:hypothetical protein